MSYQETNIGKIKLIPNIEGESSYQKKAIELIPLLKNWNQEDFEKYYKKQFPENWEEVIMEFQDYKNPQFMILNNKIYEILELEENEYGFCKMISNSEGVIEFVANWHNGGASLEEVLEGEGKRTGLL